MGEPARQFAPGDCETCGWLKASKQFPISCKPLRRCGQIRTGPGSRGRGVEEANDLSVVATAVKA